MLLETLEDSLGCNCSKRNGMAGLGCSCGCGGRCGKRRATNNNENQNINPIVINFGVQEVGSRNPLTALLPSRSGQALVERSRQTFVKEVHAGLDAGTKLPASTPLPHRVVRVPDAPTGQPLRRTAKLNIDRSRRPAFRFKPFFLRIVHSRRPAFR